MITIIIPVHNDKSFLSTCIASVRNQDVSAWECIIVDDASTDDSLDEVQRVTKGDDRFRIIHLDKNVGLAEARNIGMERANGDSLFFLDADDYISPQALAILNHARFYNPSVGRIIAPKMMHWLGSNYTRELPVTPTGLHSYQSPHLFADRSCDIGYSTGGLYVKDNIPCPLHFSPVPQHEDMIFNMGLLFAGTDCLIIDKPIYHYVRRPDSLVTQPMTVEQANLLRSELKKLVEKYNPDRDIIQRCYHFLENTLQGRLQNLYDKPNNQYLFI